MKSSPDNAREKIFQLCEQKKFDDARKYFAEMVNKKVLKVADAEHLLWQASIEGMAGNYEEENRILCSAYANDPSYTAVLFSLVRSFSKLGLYEQCEKMASKLLNIESKTNESYFSGSSKFFLSLSYLRQKDFTNFNRSISQLDDNHAEWIHGRLLSKKDMISESQEMLGKNW